MLECLFKFTKDNKAAVPEHQQFCTALKPTKRDNPLKILTKDGRAVWLRHVDSLSVLCSLRNMLEHGHAGINLTATTQDRNPRVYSRWQLLDELRTISLAFLDAIGFSDAAFPLHSDFIEFQAGCQAAASLSSTFAVAAAVAPQSLRFTIPTSSLDLGFRPLLLTPLFFGRTLEMDLLQQHLTQDRCRMVILGGAGYGFFSFYYLSFFVSSFAVLLSFHVQILFI